MATTANAQYHHYVPRFLLKNFSHPYKPDGGRHGKRKGAGKPRYEKGMFPNDPVVRNLDLLADPPVINEKPVGRILGQTNMYQDTSRPIEEQQHIELMLARLESQASMVFQKVIEHFEQKEPGFWVTRDERNLLRKFLFLLKYRNDGSHRRFCHNTPEEYSENDRERLWEYMAKHGFERPVDVWLQNIKAIIELEMDPEGKWLRELRKRMYPDDAMWFYTHAESSYMAICTPSNPDDEFILTNRSYGIFEGPNQAVQDIETGEVGDAIYMPLHEFAPISPKLMIILRSNLLPDPLEDAEENVRKGFNSLLADLPIRRARNNYSRVVGGRIVRLGRDENWRPKKDDRFYFTFFPINSNHVHTINAILLDNCAHCSSVVFESPESFARTLEWFLTAPCDIGKLITGVDAELREVALQKLEEASRALGSTKETVWVKVPTPLVRDYNEFRLERAAMLEKMDRIIDGGDGELLDWVRRLDSQQSDGDPQLMRTYELLGGSTETMTEDIVQAERMWTLRLKIDTWSKGKVDEAIRQRNRELLIGAYLRLPPRRVWLFTKNVRFAMINEYEGNVDASGPEDAVAECAKIVSPKSLARLIYTAGYNGGELRSRSWLDLWGPFPRDVHGFLKHGWSFRHIVFNTPGYIRDCGIDEVQQLARQAQREILRAGRYMNMALPFKLFNEGERIELLTRVTVRERFADSLGSRLKAQDLKELKRSLFESAYPTPPLDWEYKYVGI
ncbi:hypothetical protein N656DRAFT_782896 [Canariomyces notabilis]|uniref:DUF4238 domain-containing protein n=1 Tax=Canariomyces notabilis TaxID=2074819 RepID=A0AAN6QHB1_9PEZI|nr:hypothetical protein N656DRAFT_782896 [Canariomyces arenarius]